MSLKSVVGRCCKSPCVLHAAGRAAKDGEGGNGRAYVECVRGIQKGVVGLKSV